MNYGYVLKLSSKKIYKEIQLPVDCEMMKIGMDISCDVRLYKEDFFEAFELDLTKKNNEWQIICSENTYVDAGDVRKLVSKSLKHGDIFTIKYQNSDQEVFKAEFLYDFDNGEKNYDRVIAIANMKSVTIGSASNSNIVLRSQYVQNDSIALQVKNNDLILLINKCNCGVYHNGKKASNKEVIKNGDFISVADFSFYYKDGKLMTEASDFLLPNIQYYDNCPAENYPKFNRNTRIKYVISDEKIEILDPPAKPQKPKNNLISRLLPSAVMIISGIAMVAVSPIMLVSSGVGVITAIISIIQGKKDFKNNSAERIEKYNNYIENKRAEIEQCRDEEKATLEKIYISTEEETDNFDAFSSDLFDRTAEDEDFLNVRLGIGDVEAKREINYKKQEKLEVEDDLQQKPKQLFDEYKYLHDTPVVCDLKDTNAIGIIGDELNRFNIMKNIVIDICARQFQSDVKLFFVAEKNNKSKVHWLRMLPHVYNEVIGVRNIVCDDESKNIIFEYLYKELTLREQNKKFDKRFIVFLYDEYGFKNHPISKFVDKAKELGVTFVFFADAKADIALGCNYLVDVHDNKNATLIDTSDANKSVDFTYSSLSDEQAKNIVEILAPVYTEEISLEGTLTKNISLFKMLNIIAVDDIDLARNWKTSQVFKSMAAPLGVSKSGIISLDLHDKAHGPHGLVAGTTGSGKSEILQTYILSMATLFHPYEVGFVIIDFKGGGMVNQFKNLPHLVGAITNIDGKEIDRSLKSIKAELQKRQRLFAEAEVNHIDKYIKKFKAGEVSTPLPHLILIVDEFAELKAEQPEFMKELISAARIGRSLGVHLILATQKPSGQVDDQIWSNSRFKLCLKVQDQADSNEVLKSPLAAEIKEPGRAYLQVGNNEIFELFQSAYSGAPEKADNSNFKEFSIFALTDSGKRVPVYVQKKKKSQEGNRSQLDAIVSYVAEYAEKNNIKKLPDICLPPLATVIDYQNGLVNDFSVPIGIYDDPDNQLQTTYGINIFSDNTLIIGSSMSGKTNLLQLIIRGIAHNFSPSEVSIYIIDFASMVLKNFEGLNHVGGVVVSNEDEKLKNLFKLLTEQIEVRKEKLLSAGVSNFMSYKEAGYTDLPQIVLMIDNLTALNELYLQDNDVLLNLTREGLAVGISVIVANSQTNGIGYRYMSNFSSKVALFCNDSGEYSSVFDYCRMKIEPIAGRSIIEKDKQHYECQTFLSFKGDKEFERVTEMKNFISVANSKYPNQNANIIPVIPDVLTQQFVETQLSFAIKNPYDVVVGLNYANVSPFVLNLANLGTLAITGREGMGKSNFIKYVLSSLQNRNSESVDSYVIDNISRKLTSVQDNSIVKSYSIVAETAVDTIIKIESELKTRYEALMNGQEDILDKSNLIVFVINNTDALECICNDLKAYEAYKNINSRYKNMNVCILVGDFPNVNISYSSPEIFRNIRDSRHFLYFDDIDSMKVVDLPLALMRQFKKPVETGDCYYINDNECDKIKSTILYLK